MITRSVNLPAGGSEAVMEGREQSYRAIEALFEVKPWIKKGQTDE